MNDPPRSTTLKARLNLRLTKNEFNVPYDAVGKKELRQKITIRVFGTAQFDKKS